MGSDKRPPPFLVEACVESLDQATHAARQGAHRIELCADLAKDGLTPPFDLVEEVLRALQIPVRVMIRSRPGDFCYSESEIEGMARDMEQLKTLPVDGFVFGLLDETGNIHIPGTWRLARAARPFHVTFHKAIDATPDPVRSVRQLKDMGGISSILTSGGAPTAIDGAATIRRMLEAAGDDIEIIACGKVTAQNHQTVHRLIGAPAYHGRRIV